MRSPLLPQPCILNAIALHTERLLYCLGVGLFLHACGSEHIESTIALVPTDVSLSPGQTVRFTAHVTGTLRGDVEWSVENANPASVGIAVGTIDSQGRYVAPESLPPDIYNRVIVRARSLRNPQSVASAAITLVRAPIDPPRGVSTGGTVVRIQRRTLPREDAPSATPIAITFGEVPGKIVQSESALAFTVVTPPHPIGLVDVSISYADGTTELYPRGFHFGAAHLDFSGGVAIPMSCSDALTFQTLYAELDGCSGMEIVSMCHADRSVFIEIASRLDGEPTIDRYPLDTNTGVDRVAIGDVNQDGWPDLVSADAKYLRVMLNAGAPAGCGTWGGFGASTVSTPTVAADTLIVHHALLADANGDNVMDLFLAGPSATSVMRGLGDGAFESWAEVPASGTAMVVGDVDGDGFADIATASKRYGQVLVALYFFNELGFRVLPVLPSSTACASSLIPTLTVADLDGNGADDIIVGTNPVEKCGLVSKAVAIHNDASNGFRSFPLGGAYSGVEQLTVSDFNTDGFLDVAAFSPIVNTLLISWGTGAFTGYWQVTRHMLPPASKFALQRLTASDVPQLILTRENHVMAQDAALAEDGTLNFGPTRTTIETKDGMDLLPFREITSDTLLVDSQETPDGETLWVSTFTDPGSFVRLVNLGTSVAEPRIAAGDVDADGLTDLIVTGTGGDPDTGLPVPFLGIAWGNGSGFEPPMQIPLEGATSLLPVFAVADFDGNGAQDVVLALLDDTYETKLVLLSGTANGVSAPTALPWEGNVQAIASADIDLDSDVDLVVLNVEGDLNILSNQTQQGDPEHWEVQTVGGGPWATTGLAIGDLDNDGYPEVSAAGPPSQASASSLSEIVVWKNQGGTLSSSGAYTWDSDTIRGHELALGDLDGDGLADMIATSLALGDVYVLRNNGLGGLESPRVFYSGEYYSSPAVCDFSGDGLPDIILKRADSVQWLRNLSQ